MAMGGPWPVEWGWSLAWWFQGLSLVVFCAGGFLGCGGVLMFEGPRPPLGVGVGFFSLGFIHFGVGGWPFVSKIK